MWADWGGMVKAGELRERRKGLGGWEGRAGVGEAPSWNPFSGFRLYILALEDLLIETDCGSGCGRFLIFVQRVGASEATTTAGPASSETRA